MRDKIKTALSALLDARQAVLNERVDCPNSRIIQDIERLLERATDAVSEALRTAETHIKR